MPRDNAVLSLWRTFRFISGHPLVASRRSAALKRWARWQIGSRVVRAPVAVPFVDGTRLLAAPGMTGATGNVYVGLAEFEEMAFAMHFLSADDLFVDVGANVGVYSVIASGVCHAHTIAFEPVADAYAALMDNIVLNRLSDLVQPRREAVGAAPGTVRFTQTFDTTNHVALNGERGVDVPITTLDAALAGRVPTFIKVDTEGYEVFVLDGARATLETTGLRALMLELGGAGERYGRAEKDIVERMRRLGFSMVTYYPLNRDLVVNSTWKHGNILFVRDVAEARARLARAPRRRVLDRFV